MQAKILADEEARKKDVALRRQQEKEEASRLDHACHLSLCNLSLKMQTFKNLPFAIFPIASSPSLYFYFFHVFGG